MKYKLINPPNELYSAKKQVLINRGLDPKEIDHYLNLTDADINDPSAFDDPLLTGASGLVWQAIKNQDIIAVIVDCDCDGYTSAAILINFLYDIAPDFTENNVHWFMHEGKQHGLPDAMDWIEDIGANLVIVPDAGSNDIEEIRKLWLDGRKILILDHHELEGDQSTHCYLINSQFSWYPNHELSGAGVVWQFCRFMDRSNGTNYADWYLDLVALGLTGDMMSLKSPETRRLIFKGLEPARIHNPFIYEMWQKNKFKLTDNPTSWGATFYIVPLVNAITRSGTLEEKELIFKSMLKFKALEQIPSNKRGHKLGETERLVDQAIRTCTNVKNRQTREEEKGIELVTNLIEKNNMLDHKVLLFLLEPGAIKPEIRGLVANKLMAKYQHPCCMLTKTITPGVSADVEMLGTGKIIHVDTKSEVVYQGSARGCDKVGINDFKDICAATAVCEYTIGHQGAFGLGLREDNIETFIEKTDEILKDMPNEPTYYVDYIWTPSTADATSIIEIADLAPYWGKDIDESLVAIQNVEVTKDNITMMASNTCKITLPNGIAMIKFRMPDEEYDKLYSETGCVTIDVIGKCNCNLWGGNKYAQIIIEDYEIKKQCAYVF